MKFLDVKTDFAFKKVFGSEGSKDILLSFLNALMRFPDGSVIADLTVVDPYQLPMLKGMKDTYVDVKAKLSNGMSVIIEMQVLNVPGFEQRILYNAAKAYSTQLMRAEHYHELNPVIALTLTDFVMFDDLPDWKSTFRLIEKQHLIEYKGDIELAFIELPKFTKTESELVDITDKWIYFIKHAGSLEYIPDSLASTAELRHAFEVANEIGLTPEEHEAQWKRRDFIMLQRGSIALATQQGRIEGREEGRKQASLAIARQLIGLLDAATIAQKTGLSLAEIQAIALER